MYIKVELMEDGTNRVLEFEDVDISDKNISIQEKNIHVSYKSIYSNTCHKCNMVWIRVDAI